VDPEKGSPTSPRRIIAKPENQDGREAAVAFLTLHRKTLSEAEKDVVAAPQKNPGQPLATNF